MFPIGGLQKGEVRALAQKFGLPNAERKDSQGLCFLGKIRFDKFLEFHLGKKQGDLIDHETGKKMGEHEGFWYYTIGQRRGIHLSGGPWYVVAKDAEKNIVYISNAWRSLETARDTFEVENLNWISGKPDMLCRPEFISGPQNDAERSRIKSGMTDSGLQVKIRHGEKLFGCTLKELESGRLQVTLDEVDTGIAPGQFAVFYDGEYCLGGGVIVG
jgi:tRNA-specific 2-thiouridylase